MKRNILLIEPNYQNKYPPIGLMKISTYHRMIGDEITFFKGNLSDFVLQKFYERSLFKLRRVSKKINWKSHSKSVKQFIKTKDRKYLENINLSKVKLIEVEKCLSKYFDIIKRRKYTEYPKYDRVYVTTLFTFYWAITVQTIKFAKRFTKNESDLYVGGVMASLLTKEIEIETGIRPITGLLDQPGLLDKSGRGKNIIIDNLPLDYSILDEIDYKYPTDSAYFTFMTKGCTRKCSFCSVPKLEPTYKPKIETIEKFKEIKKTFGEQRNLLLMDNNVLASPFFSEIVQEIKDMGFEKGATYIEPNQLEIAIENLRKGFNDRAFIKRGFHLIHDMKSRIRGKNRELYNNILESNDLMNLEDASKQKLFRVYTHIAPLYEKYRNKNPRLRYVDFNQGTDARYVTDEIMQRISELPIRPLRIAFDYIGLKETYIQAVELAAKYGITNLSNYILYNFNDSPDDLYERLKINVDLNQRLNLRIFSFPMKYIPLFGEEAKGREYVGKKWNKKFIRSIQSILNVTKGIVAPGKDLFNRAFGTTLNDFHHLLFMPEEYIIYRKIFEDDYGFAQIWKDQFDALMNTDKAQMVKQIIINNDFTNIQSLTIDSDIIELLKHYTIKKPNDFLVDQELIGKKIEYSRLIRQDQFLELTLTYDFE